jgi:hypothetical protein
MTRFTKFAIALAAAAACAACVAVVDLPLTAPQPIVSLRQLQPEWGEPIFYGPLTVEYELTVFNPSDRTIVLRAIDLHTAGSGHYQLAQQTRRMHDVIPPHQTVSTRMYISAWASGGQASAYEPVTIHGVAWFDTGHGRRHRVLFEAMP